MHDLTPPSGFSYVRPVSINVHGQVLAYAHDPKGGDDAVVFDRKFFAYSSPIGSVTTTPGTGFYLLGLNAGGAILGVDVYGALSEPEPFESYVLTNNGGTTTPLQPNYGTYLDGSGINDSGTVAGIATTCASGNECPRGFIASGGKVKMLVVPGAQALSGGLINNHGNVAGAETDGEGHAHIWIYRNGAYELLLPGKSHLQASVGAFNDQGMLAALTDGPAANTIYATVWTHKGVAALGAWPTTDIVRIGGMNNQGTVVPNVTSATSTSAYIATCNGCD